MAWHYGTYSCGHEGRTDITGPTKNRQYIADRRFSGLCPECYEKHLQEENRKRNKESLEKAMEMELPLLEGSEKQIAWANTIRQSFIDDFNNVIQEAKEKNKAIFSEALNYWIETHTKASWYIDNKAFWDYKAILRSFKEHMATECDEVKARDTKTEATVFPKHAIIDIPVEIIVTDDSVKVVFEKNDSFMKIIKKLGYKWNGAWIKEISETTGTSSERAAELGHTLLNAGFPIILYDDIVRNNAISGNYKLECKRWIKWRNSEDRLAINWVGKDDILYKNARKIKSSLWSNPSVTVKIENYKEVEDFAEMYGFKFTKSAQEAISKYKEVLANAIRVTPISVKQEETRDKLQDILNSSREVLDDLRDDK